MKNEVKKTPVIKLAAICLIVFGILLLATNILFRVMKWPVNDMYQGHITGPVFLITGLVLLVVHFQQVKKKT